MISVYDGPKEEKNFYKLCKDLKLKENQSVIRNRYDPNNNYGLNLSNRSGNLKNAEFKVQPLAKSLQSVCNYPAYTFFLDYNGDVQMCSHDWGKKYIIGNVKKEKINEIRKNKKLQLARKN